MSHFPWKSLEPPRWLRTVVAVEVRSFVGIAAAEAFVGIVVVDLERVLRQVLLMILQTWTKKREDKVVSYEAKYFSPQCPFLSEEVLTVIPWPIVCPMVDPTATPAAVDAICPKRPGCRGWLEG